jgi:hypothetical protein
MRGLPAISAASIARASKKNSRRAMDKPDYYTEKEWKELEAERDRKRAKERRAP